MNRKERRKEERQSKKVVEETRIFSDELSLT